MISEIDKEFFLRTQLAGDKPAKIKPNDICFSCPLCREDSSFGKKQRLHLYTKPNLSQNLVHCYNCSYHSTLPNYLKEVDPELYKEYKQKTKNQYLDNLKSPRKKKEEIKIIEGQPNGFIDIPSSFKQNVKPLIEYLDKRNLKEFSYLFYHSDKDIFLNDKILPIKDSIIIPLMFNNKMYGFQARKIKEKRFYTYLPDINSGFKVWNYYNIDKNKPVFIFESVFDALSSGLPLNNIIAGLGADVPEKLIKELKYPIFALDNPFKDKKAKEKYQQLIDKYHCVLWGKDLNIKDFNELTNMWNKEKIKEYILKNVKKGLKAKLILDLS